MKYTLILSAAAFSLLLPAVAYPQQEQEKDRPQQEERQKAEPENHQQTDRTQQEEKKQQDDKQKQAQGAEKQAPRQEKAQQEQIEKDRRQQTDTEKKQADRQHDSKVEHGRIPEDRFRASFGREHTFRVERRDDRRFQYGGFWFTYSAWPVGWAYTDAVYVDEIDGQYYLIDLVHPGVRVLLVIG